MICCITDLINFSLIKGLKTPVNCLELICNSSQRLVVLDQDSDFKNLRVKNCISTLVGANNLGCIKKLIY